MPRIEPPSPDCIYDYEPETKVERLDSLVWELYHHTPWKCHDCGTTNSWLNEHCVYCRLRSGVLNARPISS